MPRTPRRHSLPDPSSWSSLRRVAASRRDGHPNVTVDYHAELSDRMLDQGFVGTMSLGIEVATGTLRIQSMGKRIRQDLSLISSDGTETTWQQICTQRRDAVEVELVRLDPASERGKGRGVLAYRNFLLWCDLAGVEQVALEAGKDVGGYFWARCGFLPDEASWKVMCLDWQRKAKRAEEDELLALLEAVSALGPIGLVTLARSDYAKSLLHHARWRGLLDLTNPEQRDRARQYAIHNPPP